MGSVVMYLWFLGYGVTNLCSLARQPPSNPYNIITRAIIFATLILIPYPITDKTVLLFFLFI